MASKRPIFRWLALAFLLLSAGNVLSFQTSSMQRGVGRIHPATTLSISTIDDPSSSSTSLRQRMINRLKKSAGPKTNKRPTRPRAAPSSHLVQEVTTLEEFKRVVTQDAKMNNQLVVVWFYAPWCRACKATAHGYYALAKNFDNIKFIQIPVTPHNTDLHQGLGVVKVPFGHIYHPTAGLVEERRLSRRFLPGWNRLLQDYQGEECSLFRRRGKNCEEVFSSDSPYEPMPNARDAHAGTALRP